jgi:diaminohydroxyphosphoribosylaminopyrimidine deaminase / 5-amino-6-(5-phosphoribosylamino)uracil reductase
MNLELSNQYMQQALQLAQERRGFCAPNPAVGAVLVKAGKVIAQGTHWACGYPHAEAAALQTVGTAAGATLYVTLEPCSHHGKTPPCTDLLIRSGIQQVFFGMSDPNPTVSGQGAAILQQAGIDCQLLPSQEIDRFYQSYRYWLKTQLPWVTLKLAISLDGKIAGAHATPVALTGEECRRLTHQLRGHSDALLTTAATIIADNPQLNVRLAEKTIAKPLYVLDRRLELPVTAQVLHTAQSVTLLHADDAAPSKQRQWQRLNVRCVSVTADSEGLDLPAVLAVIGADGCHDLWVEAGSRCFQAFLTKRLAQRAYLYVAPKILGETAKSGFEQPFDFLASATHIAWQAYGADVVAQIELF